jgi:hypothetical protein
MLTVYFKQRSQMTAFAAHSQYKVVRCKQACEHVQQARPAILLLDKSTVVAKLVRCKVCNQIQFGEEVNHG